MNIMEDPEPSRRGFQWYDYLIFIATLLVSLGIGVYSAFAGKGQQTTKQYLMGNRDLGVIPVALSMFMSYISAILVLGNTAEMYQYGPMQWLACIGSSLAYASTALFFVPLFYPLKLTSSFEYLQKRFDSKAVTLTGTLLLMLSQIFYMGIAMFSPATALDSVTGFPTWASILATGVVATIYTAIGGMKAVIWTDVFQAVVMLGGVIAVLIAGSIELGGFGRVWEISTAEGRTTTWDISPSPFLRISVWSVLLGRFVSSSQTVGTGQTSVQRYCAVKTIGGARWSVILNIPLMIIVYTLTCMVGFVVFAFYHDRGCDPLRSGEIDNANQLLPYFIVEGLQLPALPGLFVAVLFSGSLSTISSSMNSLAAVTWKDMLEWKFHDIPESRKAMVTKILSAFFGAVAIGFAFVAEILGGHVLQASQSFVSGVAGPLLGVFILGAFFPCANWIGAVTGAWLGLALTMVCTVGNYVEQPYREVLNATVENCQEFIFNSTVKPIPTNPPDVNIIFRVSFLHYAGIGTFTCVAVGVIVSLFTKCWAGPETIGETDPRLVIPVFDRLLCCLPKSLRSKLWCGIPYDQYHVGEGGVYVDANGQPVGWGDENDEDDEGDEKDPPDVSKGYEEIEIGKKELDNGNIFHREVRKRDSPPPSYAHVNEGYLREDSIASTTRF